jgi:hypothetical protein
VHLLRTRDVVIRNQNFWRKLLTPFLVTVGVLSLAVLLIPVLDGPNSHRTAREAVAVGNLHRLAALQASYSATHPDKGFACQLSLLKSNKSASGGYDPDGFLLLETYVGYRINLIDCEPGPNGLVTRYRAIAVPLEPGKSGFRAFCSDQTGALWYDASGSPENCLSARRTID